MSSPAEEYVKYRIANSIVREYPYPHFYVESVFPDEYYWDIRKNLPDNSSFVALPDTGRVRADLYKERFVLPMREAAISKLPAESQAFWRNFASWLLGAAFMDVVIGKFRPFLGERFDLESVKLKLEPESLLVRDRTNYSIGPHTDAPHRLASLLFYLPSTDDHPFLGTSIYRPKNPDFTCEGGPHYPYDQFDRVITMPYKPNALFAFLKTEDSFHGVEPITAPDIERDLLLYDIRIIDVVSKAQAKQRGLVERMFSKVF